MGGLWFEEFHLGQVFRHPLARTITETDNVWFSCLTMNPQPLHVDFQNSAETEFGQPLVNSFFTLGLLVGLSINDITTGTTIANLGLKDVQFCAPVFHGDTLRAETQVVMLRPSKSRPAAGVAGFAHRAYNQSDTLVAHCQRTVLLHRRPQPP